MPNKKQFENLRQTETASVYSDFNFAQNLREISQAEHWKEKRALWTLISGACNDAGREFYEKIREFVENIADIDMCTSKALKSMAESVNASYLTDFIKTDYPPQLQRLIDIFSISRSNLLRQYNKLHENAIAHKYGMINIRNKEIYPDEYKISLMYDILDNLDEIRYTLETLNGIDFNLAYWNNIDINNVKLDVDYYFHCDGKTYRNPSLNKIFEELEYYKSLVNVSNNSNDTKNGIYGGVSYQENIDGKFLGEYVTEDVTKYFMLKKCTQVMREANFMQKDSEISSNKYVYAYNLFPKEVLNDPDYYNHISTLYYEQTKILRKSLNNFNENTFSKNIKFYLGGEDGNNLPDGMTSNSIVQIYSRNESSSTLESEYYYSELPDTYEFEDGKNYDIYTIDSPRSNPTVNITINDRIVNPFMILISVFKNKIVDFSNNTALKLSYTDPITNSKVNISSLVYRMVETIQNDTKSFHEYYLSFHFYGLFYDMIVNDYLKNQWSFSESNEVVNTTFEGIVSELTEEELWNKVNHYISFSEFSEFTNTGINRFQHYHVDFIQYLSLLNNFLVCENTETINKNLVNSSNVRFPYIITKFNNDLPIDHSYNAEYRRLLSLTETGAAYGVSPLLDLARSFADYCIQISIARDNVKAVIQQYARIGTNKIIEDATAEFFLKQMSNRNDWGLYSEKSVGNESSDLYSSYGMFNNIEKMALDTSSDYFKVDLIEYYDTTNYLNIQAELPNFIDGYTDGDELSTYIDETSTVQLSSVMVTWKLDEDTVSGSEYLGFDIVSGQQINPISAFNFSYTSVVSTSSEITSGYLSTYISNKSVNVSVDPPSTVFEDFTTSKVDLLTSDEREYFNQKYLDPLTSATFLTPKYFSSLSTNVTSSNLSSLVDSENISGFIEGTYQYLIPSGTLVYKIVPSTVTVNLQTLSTYFEQIPNIVPCSDFVSEYNSRFWTRDTSTVSEEKLLDEIEFWTPFFSVLQTTNTVKNKKKVFNNEVYPFLCKIWETYATSGFLDNSELSGMQLKYAGKYPGLFLTENIGNPEFPTIAPVQNIENLVTESQIYNNSLLYLIKPYYDEMVYYINLVARQILDMHKINQETGLGTPYDGWEQIRNEYYGYNSIYEQAEHTTDNSQTPSKIIDVDGPWVYSTLQQFVKLYYDNEIVPGHYQIPYNKIFNFVDQYYPTIINNQIKENYAKKVFVFQHEIIKRQYYRVYDFQTDDQETQFVLYKHTDFDKYEDCGEIWLRIKDHGLALPAMHYTIVEEQYGVYENDVNDVMQCDEQVTYSNMLRQLFNNAMQFGVLGNTIWIFGKSNYINYGQGLQYVPTQLYNKLCFIQFNYSIKTGTFKFDLATCKFFSLSQSYDFINDINEFVGVYYNRYKKSFEAILYDKTAFINNITTYNASNVDSLMDLSNLSLPLTLMTYDISSPTYSSSVQQTFLNASLPIAGMFEEKQIVDSKRYSFYDQYITLPSTAENAPVIFSTSGLLEQFVGYAVELSGSTQSLTGWININPSTNILGIYFDALNIPKNMVVTSLTTDDLDTRLLSSNAFPTNVKLDGTYMLEPEVASTALEYDNLLSGIWVLNEFKPVPTSYKVLYNGEVMSGGIRIIDIHQPQLTTLDDSLSAKANDLLSGYMTSDTNVWRINNDLSRVNIAYESINVDEYLGNRHFYDKLLEPTKSYYVDVLQLTFDISVIKQGSVYMTVFKNYKYEKLKDKISIPVESRKALANSSSDLAAIHNSYPYCNITSDNKLVVRTIVTRLGGDKDVDIETESAKKMLMSTISDDFSKIIDSESDISVAVESDGQLPEPYLNILSYVTNDFLTSENTRAAAEVQTIINDLIYENECITPKEYADSIITSTNNFEIIKLSDSLQNGTLFGTLYNEITKESLDKLGMLAQTSLWVPCTTDCLVEPLKIVCNFGDLPDSVKDFIVGKESFDLDISVYINDSEFENIEINKPVGWHCGYKKTDYVDWITDDVTINGPEIVLVDLQKYKNHILSKFKNDKVQANDYLKNVKIDVNVCWHSESMLISSMPKVDVAWKGYYNEYVIPKAQMVKNNKCCKNSNKITINVDLTNSAIYFGESSETICPVITILEEENTDIISSAIAYYRMRNYDINNAKVRLESGTAHGNEIIYFNNYNGYCNSVETYTSNSKKYIQTTWFLYDIGGVLNNRTLDTNNLNEISLNTLSMLIDTFKLEVSPSTYISPFVNESPVTEHDEYDNSIMSNYDSFSYMESDAKRQSKLFSFKKSDMFPASFSTEKGIYSDIDSIFKVPFTQKYDLTLLPEDKIIAGNIDIFASNCVTVIANEDDKGFYNDDNNHYYVRYRCIEGNKTIDSKLYDEKNILNDYSYTETNNECIKNVKLSVVLFYIRKFSEIILNSDSQIFKFYNNPWTDLIPLEFETVIGTNVSANISDKVCKQLFDNGIVLNVVPSDDQSIVSDFSYNTATKMITGISTTNNEKSYSFDASVYFEEDPTNIIGTFPSCCIIYNREVSGSINIKANNAIKLNDTSFAYILRDNETVTDTITYDGMVESNTLNDKTLLSEFNLTVSSETKYE